VDGAIKKYVDFSYLVMGVLFAWLGIKMVDWIWSFFERLPNPELLSDVPLSTVVGLLVGVGVTVYLRVKPSVYQLASECGIELKKTIWPGWDETKSNTIVVIVVAIIMGMILWVFDLTWKTVTDLLYQ
jgi:preprotein translocase SecE subunit